MSKLRESTPFQQGFKTLEQAQSAAAELETVDSVEWAMIVAVTTLETPHSELLGYIVVSNET